MKINSPIFLLFVSYYSKIKSTIFAIKFLLLFCIYVLLDSPHFYFIVTFNFLLLGGPLIGNAYLLAQNPRCITHGCSSERTVIVGCTGVLVPLVFPLFPLFPISSLSSLSSPLLIWHWYLDKKISVLHGKGETCFHDYHDYFHFFSSFHTFHSW